MPVRYTPPTAQSLLPVPGVLLGPAAGRIKKWDRNDVLLVACEAGTVAAGVFTQNRFCAAPVIVCREHLTWQHANRGGMRALIVNAGNANAGTGEAGLADARAECVAVARLLGCAPEEVLVYSTGVIMEPLPVERIVDALPAAQSALRADHWFAAANAIMTTDTVPKGASRRVTVDGVPVMVTGIAKGAGMIHPNMATMLSFVTTDASVETSFLDAALRRVADRTYNMVTVDGDTSCDDMVVLMANGAAGGEPINEGEGGDAFEAALFEVCRHLAREIARDGEGASKLIEVTVETAASDEDARRAALAVAGSMLLKSAVKGSDPNWGRIMNAVGYSGAEMVEESACVYIDDIMVYRDGLPIPFDAKAASARMAQPEVRLRVTLGLGDGSATGWGCDLTEEYVRINADYTT